MRLEEQSFARLHAVDNTEGNKKIRKGAGCPGDSSWLAAAAKKDKKQNHIRILPL